MATSSGGAPHAPAPRHSPLFSLARHPTPAPPHSRGRAERSAAAWRREAKRRQFESLRPSPRGPLATLPTPTQGEQATTYVRAARATTAETQRFVAWGESNGVVSLVSLDEERVVARTRGKPHARGGVRSLSWFAFDEGLFATAGGLPASRQQPNQVESRIVVWDSSRLGSRVDHNGEVCEFSTGEDNNAVAFSRGAEFASVVASAGASGNVRLLDLRTGNTAHVLLAHEGAALCVAWSPVDDSLLASGGVDGRVLLFDVRRTDACVGALDQFNQSEQATRVHDAVFSSSSSSSATSSADAKRQRRQTFARSGRGSNVTAHSRPVTDVAFVDGGRGIVSVGGSIPHLWSSKANEGAGGGGNQSDARLFRRLHVSLPALYSPALIGPRIGVADSCGLLFAPLASPQDHVVAAIDVSSGAVVRTFAAHEGVSSFAVRDGFDQQLLVCSRDGVNVLWVPSSSAGVDADSDDDDDAVGVGSAALPPIVLGHSALV